MNIKKGIRKILLPLAVAGHFASLSACNGNQDNNLNLQAKVDSIVEFEDGINGSLRGKILPGSDWVGDAYEITNVNKNDTKVVRDTSFTDENLEDGVEYDYTIKGLDSSTGKPTGSEISGSFVPFEDAYDYNFEIDAKDKRFDDKGYVNVTPSFDSEPKGNRVSLAHFTLLDTLDQPLDNSTFYDLDRAEEGFLMSSEANSNGYRGPVQVLGELRLERGNNVAALDSAEVLDDMPQFITGTVGQNKDLQGFLMQATNFYDRAQADSLYGKLEDNPALVRYDTLRVDFSGNDPDRLVGECWVTPDGKATNYKEAFSE